MLVSTDATVPLVASSAFSAASASVSLVLYHKHGDSSLSTGPDIVSSCLIRAKAAFCNPGSLMLSLVGLLQQSRYIMSVESYHNGLHPLAIVFVLPHALNIYSAAGFSIALIKIVIDLNSSIVQLLMTLAIMSLGVLPIIGTLVFFGGYQNPLYSWQMWLVKILKTRKGRPRPEGKQKQEDSQPLTGTASPDTAK